MFYFLWLPLRRAIAAANMGECLLTGLWKLYWRSLWAYRGAKSVQAEWKAAGKRQAARDAADKAAKRKTSQVDTARRLP